MIYGVDTLGNKVKANKETTAKCPICHGTLVARCGDINVHHWAHENNDCDSWYEGETVWHQKWKSLFQKQEVTIGNHRADAINEYGMIVEIQHSNISKFDVNVREDFYEYMMWIIDCTESKIVYRKCSTAWYGNEVTYQWKWPKKSFVNHKCPLFLDFGDHLLHVKTIHSNTNGTYGYGSKINRKMFDSYIKQMCQRDHDIILPNLNDDTGLYEKVLARMK